MNHPSCEETVVVKKRDLHHGYYSMLLGPYSRAGECRPGSFLHLRLPSTNLLFRRAMSVANVDPPRRLVEIIFRVLGRGTAALALLGRGDRIDLLGPLGIPFAMPKRDEHVIMVAGGVGFPPLLFLTKAILSRKHDAQRIDFFYGGKTEGDLVERARIKKLGVNFHATTDDGSLGTRGYITGPAEQFIKSQSGKKLRMYACGPEAMLKAANDLGLCYKIAGQVSLEAPMPCGIGVCLGCVVPLTVGGYARVCCEGPVFNIGEVRL